MISKFTIVKSTPPTITYEICIEFLHFCSDDLHKYSNCDMDSSRVLYLYLQVKRQSFRERLLI